LLFANLQVFRSIPEPDLAWSARRGWPAISAAVAAAKHISDLDLTWKTNQRLHNLLNVYVL